MAKCVRVYGVNARNTKKRNADPPMKQRRDVASNQKLSTVSMYPPLFVILLPYPLPPQEPNPRTRTPPQEHRTTNGWLCSTRREHDQGLKAVWFVLLVVICFAT